MPSVSRRFFVPLLAAFAVAIAPAAVAETYPDHPIRLVVPFPPGGPTDVVARLVGERLRSALGQSVVIDNRPGAGGTIGSDAVAKAAPDGYTLLFGSTSTLAISPALYPNLPYDPQNAFVPVALITDTPLVLVVSKGVPAGSVRELIDYAKAHPGKLNYASSGNGTPPHLTAEMFKSMTGTNLVHVPFRGGAPALTALIAGDVQLDFEAPSVVLPHIQEGTMRALGVAGAARIPDLPDVPTITETVPGFFANSWTGLAAPAGTPAAIVERLNREINAAIRSPDFRDSITKLGLEPKGGTPQDFAEVLRQETRKWAEIVRASGAKLD